MTSSSQWVSVNDSRGMTSVVEVIKDSSITSYSRNFWFNRINIENRELVCVCVKLYEFDLNEWFLFRYLINWRTLKNFEELEISLSLSLSVCVCVCVCVCVISIYSNSRKIPEQTPSRSTVPNRIEVI